MWHGVFEDSGLRKVRLATTLTEIGYSAFERCKDLQSVLLPDGLERIGKYCFHGTGIGEITLPTSTRVVGASAFFGCERLKSVRLNEGLASLGVGDTCDEKELEGYAFAKSGLESVTLPSTLRTLLKNTFWACERLSKVEFAEGLEMIGRGAFEESGLVDVNLPASLRTVS